MLQPLFDFDLKRVSRRHYITGKAAINFPHPGCTTGGWHFLSYFDREAGVAKVSLAGIHYPDTDAFFGDMGISDVTEQLRKRGWPVAQASDSANTACSPTDKPNLTDSLEVLGQE